MPDQFNVILLKFHKSQFEVVHSSHKLKWGKQEIVSIKTFGECIDIIRNTRRQIQTSDFALDWVLIFTDDTHNVVVYFSNVSI